MKKIAKLSLVAAIAVSGFTSANAQSLEEAIKGVETSGSVVYRYNDYNNDNAAKNNDSTTTNHYKVGMNLASKVNEDVKFNSRFLVGGADGGFAALESQSTGDSNVDVELSNVYFGYTGIQNTTVNVGKQGLTTPWTVAVDSDGNEQTGTGILALSTVGPVTLAGAYFNQTNLGQSGGILKDGSTFLFSDTNGDGVWQNTEPTTGSSNDAKISSRSVATIGAIAVAGPVTIDAWYLDMADTFDSYTVGAKSALDINGIKLGADARFASLTTDATGSKANTMGKLVLTADAGLVDGKIAYAMTDKDGGLTALDADASTTLLGWNLTALDKADADYWQAVLGFDILSNLNLSANYGNIQYAVATSDVEEEEIYGQLLYKMSKNFTTYARYGVYTKETTTSAGKTTDNNDDVRGRLQVEYTF